MPARLACHRFVARRAATAAMLLALSLASPVPARAQTADPPPGVLLRHGEWQAGIGAFQVPDAWAALPTARWPQAGWGVLKINPVSATLTVSRLAPETARQRLQPIAEQVEQMRRVDAAAEPPPPAGPPTEPGDERFVRVPGLLWQPGAVPLHRFRNGTVELVPELGHRIELTLAGRPYAFTFQNGFRTADGRPFGSGVQLRLEVAGQAYDYDLGGYGWDVRILALGDFDRDGRPDLLLLIGGPNSSHEALVLSSVAKPGRNPPTAYLSAVGC
jgi:hypothetical protein